MGLVAAGGHVASPTSPSGNDPQLQLPQGMVSLEAADASGAFVHPARIAVATSTILSQSEGDGEIPDKQKKWWGSWFAFRGKSDIQDSRKSASQQDDATMMTAKPQPAGQGAAGGQQAPHRARDQAAEAGAPDTVVGGTAAVSKRLLHAAEFSAAPGTYRFHWVINDQLFFSAGRPCSPVSLPPLSYEEFVVDCKTSFGIGVAV
jgi:hypothetical protein